ncbi:hypothetical protein [Roseobacter sp.]|uniref:hypothetical protein n=1 Tax=Roseobacter sp. TaxID=1907202 RepID=UPI00385C1A25
MTDFRPVTVVHNLYTACALAWCTAALGGCWRLVFSAFAHADLLQRVKARYLDAFDIFPRAMLVDLKLIGHAERPEALFAMPSAFGLSKTGDIGQGVVAHPQRREWTKPRLQGAPILRDSGASAYPALRHILRSDLNEAGHA